MKKRLRLIRRWATPGPGLVTTLRLRALPTTGLALAERLNRPPD